MPNTLIRFLTSAGLALSLGACAGPTQPARPEPSTATPPTSPQPTERGGYFVTITPQPGPITLNTLFSLDVRVCRDAAMTQPATGVTVVVDADMPAHRHGMNTVPSITRTGDGRFRVDGMLMHMPGAWAIFVDAGAGAAAERATFEVNLR